MPEEEKQQSGTLYSHTEVDNSSQAKNTTDTKTEEKEKTLVTWTAPSRPFQTRSRDFYVKIISMAILFGVVLFLIDGIMPVLIIVALLFLFYVLSTVKPENVEYKITNRGIYVGDKRVDWDSLGRFWFTNRMGTELLIVEAANVIGRLEFIFPEENKGKIEEVLKKYLVHEQIPPNFFDKAAQWASDKLPLE